jgi:hypothetical protein
VLTPTMPIFKIEELFHLRVEKQPANYQTIIEIGDLRRKFGLTIGLMCAYCSISSFGYQPYLNSVFLSRQIAYSLPTQTPCMPTAREQEPESSEPSFAHSLLKCGVLDCAWSRATTPGLPIPAPPRVITSSEGRVMGHGPKRIFR